MVELPEGKMKSREGTVVDADDLMAEMIDTAKETSNELGKLDGLTKEEADNIARIVGLGALKYFILKVDARQEHDITIQKRSNRLNVNTDRSSNILMHVSSLFSARQKRPVSKSLPSYLPALN